MELPSIVRWVISLVFGAVALNLICAHWYIAVRSWVSKKRGPSLIPLIGGISGVLAVIACPQFQAWPWWIALAPAVLDLGCGIAMIGFVYTLVRSARAQH